MKKISIIVFLIAIPLYAQLNHQLEKQKYTYETGFSNSPQKVEDNKFMFGNCYLDNEGNILGQIPTFLGTNFWVAQDGYYVAYKKSKFTYDMNYAFIAKDALNGIKAMKDATQIEIPKVESTFSETGKCFTLYQTPFFSANSEQKGAQHFNNASIDFLEDGQLIKSTALYNQGSNIYGKTIDGFYYALFASENKLTLSRTNLETGKTEDRLICTKYSYISDAQILPKSNKIYVVATYGECSYNFMANTSISKGDGLVFLVLNATDLTVESENESAFPEDYQSSFKLSEGKVTSPVVYTAFELDETTYFISGNISEGQQGVVGPALIWKATDGKLTAVNSIEASNVGSKKGHITEVSVFSYNNKKYILYASTDGYYYSFSIINLSGGIDNLDAQTLDIKEAKLDFDFQYSSISKRFITSNGKLILMGLDKSHYSNEYLKIDIPD